MSLLQFGETVPGFDIKVLNEREARAGAGILLLVAMIAFMNAWLVGDFGPTRIVVIGFFIDFFIRVLINPRFAPSLVLGRLAVRNQAPEYTGAAQKRFAWALGLGLATLMIYLTVFKGVRGPITMLSCLLCISLLFFETAFGICLGCKIYNLVKKDPAQLCPGGVCEIREQAEIQKVGGFQLAVLGVFIVLMSQMPALVRQLPASPAPIASGADQGERCKVPAFAKAIGHEDKWKLHNNCP